MNSTESRFLQAAREWICDGYSLDIRYVERLDLGAPQLWEASVGLVPLPPSKDMSFTIATSMVVAGQRQMTALRAGEALAQIEDAVRGQIAADARAMRLVEVQSLSYYSEPMHRERWYGPLNLDVRGNRSSGPAAPDLNLLDTQLRRALPPFDGIADLCSWLGFTDQQLSGAGPVIKIQILPPADLKFEKCTVREGRLQLELLALE